MSGLAIPQLDIDGIATCFKTHTKGASNEDELKLRVSTQCIGEMILKPLGITQYGKYEYTLIDISKERTTKFFSAKRGFYQRPPRLGELGLGGSPWVGVGLDLNLNYVEYTKLETVSIALLNKYKFGSSYRVCFRRLIRAV